jgi:hypothetical protein
MSRSELIFLLPKNWEEVPGGGASTYMRKGRTNTNALQISLTSWNAKDNVKLDPPQFLAKWLDSINAQHVVPMESYEPERMATARFTGFEQPYCRAWTIVEETDLISATFICDAVPTVGEVEEVENMILTLGVRPAQKKK